MYSEADAAALYDRLNPWDPAQWPGDAFYAGLLDRASAVLDVGRGTGGMLHWAREHGHAGRLVGIDPDGAALARARRRTDVERVDGTAAEMAWEAEFDLAVMTGHAFQFLLDDADIRASPAAVRTALRTGGRFAFETRHPQARAWEAWNPSNASELTDAAGRELRTWHEVESVVDGVVTFTGTVAAPDGTVLRVDRESLRFLEEAALDELLAEAGFEIEARYGDWERGPVTAAGREIITIARRAWQGGAWTSQYFALGDEALWTSSNGAARLLLAPRPRGDRRARRPNRPHVRAADLHAGA